MDSVAVVTHLRDLASEPQNRASIVRDRSCLAGLILFLSHQDMRVVEAALQTIRYLCENPNHCEVMRSELGMMVSLENIKNSAVSNHIRLLAHWIYMSLSLPSHQHTPDTKNKQNLQFFISSANIRAKTVTLHIHGLDDLEKKSLCEEALLKVKGVISFTFQIAIRRCTVRVKPDLATECLTSAIAGTKVLTAQQVIKNECGREVYVPMPSTKNQVDKSHCLPDYLPEEESPQKDIEKALSRPASKDETSGSWLNAAASFLSKTFYW
ncbi:armadillo repeat-containing protein 1-like [Dendropsophus ebraccatus]|uniref:armadillo repeat-containing protein 1-like n=1 Tax=Dendropsophus ebraccatus TaxID=150705 RepID=UPI00383104E3